MVRLRSPTIDRVMIEQRAASFTRRSIKTTSKNEALLLAMSMIDLTTLEGKDSPEKVRSLCRKAVRPAPDDEAVLGFRVPPVAAVCVYPNMVPYAVEELAKAEGRGSESRGAQIRRVKVASVATGFPSGQYPLEVKLEDTRRAIADGADEIDMVINRGAFLAGRYAEVFEEIVEIARVCGGRRSDGTTERRSDEGKHGSPPHSSSSSSSAFTSSPSHRTAHLKVILETGELETYDNIRRASDLAIEALHEAGAVGAFIKTSTGKVQPAATIPVTLLMFEAVRDHYLRTRELIGVKPAGGIRSAKQAVHYLVMIAETMGGVLEAAKRQSDGATKGQNGTASEPHEAAANPWLTPEWFRFGASALANDILRQLFRLKTGRYMAAYDFSEA